ncbi:hypothetical protein WU83_31355, partial [Mycobacterium nebraskense]
MNGPVAGALLLALALIVLLPSPHHRLAPAVTNRRWRPLAGKRGARSLAAAVVGASDGLSPP